jgi:hypothetical protein
MEHVSVTGTQGPPQIAPDEDEYESTDFRPLTVSTTQHSSFSDKKGRFALLIDFYNNGGGTPDAFDIGRVAEHINVRNGVTTPHPVIVAPGPHTDLSTIEALMTKGTSDLYCDLLLLLDSDGSLTTVLDFFLSNDCGGDNPKYSLAAVTTPSTAST